MLVTGRQCAIEGISARQNIIAKSDMADTGRTGLELSPELPLYQ